MFRFLHRKGKKSYRNVQSILPNSFIEYFFAIFALINEGSISREVVNSYSYEVWADEYFLPY